MKKRRPVVYLSLILNIFELKCYEISCSRKSQEFQCRGIENFSDVIEVCDLGHQICQYDDLFRPVCVERLTDLTTTCNETSEIKCSCAYYDNGSPYCACAERGVLKQLSVYSWLGVSIGILTAVACCIIFIFRFNYRRKKRLRRSIPSSSPVEVDEPPPYDVAVRLTEE